MKATRVLVLYIMVFTIRILAGIHYTYGSPLIWTDSLNYSPGDTVILSGSGFLAYTAVNITITYPDLSVHKIYAWTDGSGAFNCPYPLNGIIGTYTVTATDGTNTATTTFEDAPLVVDFKQYATKDDQWINGILQSSNSIYHEDMSVPQRTVFTNIASTSGNVHTLTLSHEATKGGIHAYDWLTDWNQGNVPPLPFVPWGPSIGPPSNLGTICQTLHNAPGSGAYEIFVDVPDDPFISKDGSTQIRINAYETVDGNRQVRICGNMPFTAASLSLSHNVANGGDTGDSDINYVLTWTSASDRILIEMAGHLAMSGDPGINPIAWGVGLGSSGVSGGPYHFKLYMLDGGSLGQQDNQIMGADILMTCTTTTELSATSITLGQSITDTAMVTGSGPTPTGTVDFEVSTDGGISWAKFGATKTLSGGSATSDPYTPLAVGTYYFRAVYSGDGTYPSSQSGDTAEPLTVTVAGSTTATWLSAASIVLGDSVHDHVHVAGLGGGFPVPTGNVQFYVKAPGGSFVALGSAVPLDANGDANSIDYTPSAVGTYYFKAVYAGDSNYSGSESGDTAEPLTVTSKQPDPSTTTTVLSDTTITLGNSVTDTVTVTGSGAVPTGSVTFQVQFGAGSFVTFSTKSLDATGHATSDPYTPSAAGSYHFRALYGGDGNYQASQSGDTAEPLTVTVAGSTTATWLSAASIVLGDSVHDHVHVAGLGGGFPVPTGNVQFYVKAPGGSFVALGSAVPLDANGDANSIDYTPSAVGTYYFKAVYAGDSNYSGSESGDTAEPLTVTAAGSTTITELSAATITLGQSVHDHVAVTGLGGSFPIPTDTVDFQVSLNGGSWTTFDAAATLSGGAATSADYTPLATGNYRFRAIYSGDSNYSGSQSADDAEPLTVSSVPPGHIIAQKATVPTGESQSFEFDASWGNNFFLTDGQQSDSGALVPGTYSVAEVNIPVGWGLTSTVVSDGSPVNALSLQAGETITVTFTNTKRGNIIVHKATVPSGDPASFEFDPDYKANFFLSDGGQSDSGALIPGTYHVDELTPAGWDLTAMSITDPSGGSSYVLATGIATVDLAAGETVHVYYTNTKQAPPAKGIISDFVWKDLDHDGIQDAGELGLPGVTIKLYDSLGNLVATTTSNGNGLYSFTVNPGSYYLEFVPPSGYVLTLQDQGIDDAKDSDPNSTTHKTAIFTVTSGQTDSTRDAGMYSTAPPVGGEWVPMNKSALLRPWITLSSAMALIAASFVYARRKKKQMN